jgi:peptidoglycan/xylan/chitin deacetylase (PgdA/CDA1 family)
MWYREAGKVEEGLHTEQIFTTILEAKKLIEKLRREHKTLRYLSGLGYRTPPGAYEDSLNLKRWPNIMIRRILWIFYGFVLTNRGQCSICCFIGKDTFGVSIAK